MKGFSSRRYMGIPLGIMIRRSIAKTVTFRVRKGNGMAGTRVGELIQDKYTYTVSDPNADNVGNGHKANFAAAVYNWKYLLTPTEKRDYNRRANIKRFLSGYNLYIREVLKGIVSMYVNRGDPASVDFAIGSFTQDAAWHDLNLASVIPTNAKAILLHVELNNAMPGRDFELRQNGNTNSFNIADVHIPIGTAETHFSMIVSPDTNRLIEYRLAAAGWTVINMTIRGWWT